MNPPFNLLGIFGVAYFLRKLKMAKVIGLDPKLLRQCSCRQCASIVEYALNEVKSFVHNDYGGGSDVVYYILCPGCGQQIQNVKHY